MNQVRKAASCAITGPRPFRFKFKYNESAEEYAALKKDQKSIVSTISSRRPEFLYRWSAWRGHAASRMIVESAKGRIRRYSPYYSDSI